MATEKTIQVFVCDPWEGYLRYLEQRCEEEWREHELELDLAREAELNPPKEEADVEYVELAVAREVCPCLENSNA